MNRPAKWIYAIGVVLVIAGIAILLGYFYSKQEVINQPVSEYSANLHTAVIDLRVPGKWRDAGTFFVQTYPHAKQEALDTLLTNLLPEDKIDLGQWGRNEPILWVLAMLDNAYGLKFNHHVLRGEVKNRQYEMQLPDSTIIMFEGYSPCAKIMELRNSKEYKANKSFTAHVEQLLTSP